jgi:hypothetical protein
MRSTPTFFREYIIEIKMIVVGFRLLDQLSL